MEVVRGRLAGLSGIIRGEPQKTSLLVPIHTLQTSIALTIDHAQLRPWDEHKEGPPSLVPPDSTAGK
jgi:hypothetical protein